MQFTCAACEKSYEISRRAFGTRNDTRTRCPACRTWLIVTRSADDALTTTVDPSVAAGDGRMTGPISGASITPAPISSAQQAALRVQAPTSVAARSSQLIAAAPVTPEPVAPARPARPAFESGVQELAAEDVVPLAQTAGPHEVGEPSTGPTQPATPAASPAVDPPPVPAQVDVSDGFFPTTPSVRASQRLQLGQDLFALPDATQRPSSVVNPQVQVSQQVSQVLQDFSVMYKLQARKSDRRKQILLGVVAVAVAIGLYFGLQQKQVYDSGIDAARDVRKSLGLLVIHLAEAEQVQVLPLPVTERIDDRPLEPVPPPATPTPTGGDSHPAGKLKHPLRKVPKEAAPPPPPVPPPVVALPAAPTPTTPRQIETFTGTTLSRQAFLKVRQARVVKLRKQ